MSDSYDRKEDMWMLLFYLVIALLLLLLFFLPGYLFLRSYTPWEGSLLVASSFGLSFVLYSSLAFLGFLLPVSLKGFHALALATILLLLSFLACRRKKTFWPLPGVSTHILLLFLACYGLAFSYQILTPLFTGAGWYGDWWESYEIVQFYLGKRDPSMVFFQHDTIPSRPPGYHLLLAFPQAFYGSSFALFALSSVLPGIAFFWPAHLLAQRILNGKALKIFSYLLIFSPFLAQSALYPWSKMLSAFYLLLAFHFYGDFWLGESAGNKGNIAWVGFWSAWAYLAHPAALFYMVGFVIFAWWQKIRRQGNKATRRQGRRGFSLFPISYYLLPALLVLLPWHLWVMYQYGPWAPITANPSWAHQSAATWGEALGIRVVNFFGNLFPLWFVEYLGGMFFSSDAIHQRLYLLYSGFLRYYYNVLPGALTTTLSLLLMYYIFRKEKVKVGTNLKSVPQVPFSGLMQKLHILQESPQPLGFFLFIQVLCGFWGMVLAQPYKVAEGITAQGMAPAVIILLLWGAHVLHGLSPRGQITLVGMIVLEFLVVRGSHLIFLYQGFLGRAGDRNLALKQGFGLAFPADELGVASWVFWLILLALLVVIAYSFMVIPQQENH